MKFIHTSDWHIGRQFHNLSLLEDQQHVIKQIIDFAKSNDVDAIIIAGDIYDRSIPPANSVDFLNNVLSEFCNVLNIPVILISGNHDSATRLGFGAEHMAPSGLHILADLSAVTSPVRLTKGQVTVNFYGIPYSEPQEVNAVFNQTFKTYDQAHSYLVDKIDKVTGESENNILISHCFIDGAVESESERPLQLGGADRVSYAPCERFDYVALGHLHSPQYKGHEHIRYSGSIMKYSFSEHTQKKGFTLVELDENGLVSHNHVPLQPLRDMRIIEGRLVDLLDAGKTDPNCEDYLLVRLTDTEAILDPIGKLRDVYPNVLHLEKPAFQQKQTNGLTQASLKRGELDMFRDFYKQVHGDSLSKEQSTVLEQVIDDITKAADNDTH